MAEDAIEKKPVPRRHLPDIHRLFLKAQVFSYTTLAQQRAHTRLDYVWCLHMHSLYRYLHSDLFLAKMTVLVKRCSNQTLR